MTDHVPYRAGFACFVGRPNAGKSTLTNAIIGSKIAITSNRPQTTRHVVRGILHRPDSQLILVDTPGLHKPRTLLGQRLNDLVRATWSETDVVGLCIPADEKVGPGDRMISKEISELKGKVVAVVTKIDLVSKGDLAKQLMAVSEMAPFADVVPCSAMTGENVDTLVGVVSDLLPESPQLYPDHMITDEPERVMIAELIREAALEGVRDELPHSIAVVIEEILEEESEGATRQHIYADIYVERPSQKAIVIGKGGARMKQVGTQARREIGKLLDSRIYLDLHVRVAKDWQRNPKLLQRLGF
ncbi:GTPase Era [Phytomonospora endophytica]|uniref:GTPase Era n=1 Tax=Phytomonospora endophytica TaxID=714109 RepID=A0A841FJR7_9ACTN|nr:GTPase Era [Phytomonospora endophytica]MBB6034078.1 GTP-binding protein Era [Phytomonospora endophytica]GIG66472.1 GTPase Era [Phytomonospora endophytica]